MLKNFKLAVCGLACAFAMSSLCGCQGETKTPLDTSAMPENSRPIGPNEAPRGDRLRPASGSQPPGGPAAAAHPGAPPGSPGAPPR